MTKEHIIEKFKEILKPYAQNQEALENFSEESNFIKDLKINSTHMVDVFLDTEQAFDIEIDNASLEQIQSTEDAVNVITKKLEEKGRISNNQ